MTEKQIEAKVCAYAKKLGCYVRKFKAPGQRGVPDRLFITPSGVVFFIEFKRAGKVPTALQMKEIQSIRSKMVNAFWTDNAALGIEFVDSMLKMRQ